MKQFLYEIYDIDQIGERYFADLEIYCVEHGKSSMLAHVFYGENNFSKIQELIDCLKLRLPGIHIIGTTSSGEVKEGRLTDQGIEITISVFDKTETKTILYDVRDVSEQHCANALMDLTEKEGDIAALEVFLTVKQGFEVSSFLKTLNKCKENLPIFGAGADNHKGTDKTCVFTEDGILEYGVAAVFYLGAEFHIWLDYSLGWKPLGRFMTATKAKGNCLYELNHEPAFQIYKKYLKIENDKDFFENILEFPLLCAVNGDDIARVPISCTKEGALILGADIEEACKVRLAYGDPVAIMAEIAQKQELMREFEPEAIFLYSCVTRRSFWKYYVNKELEPFEDIAHASGFYTFGEIVRKNGKLMMHNSVIITIGMREGEKKGNGERTTLSELAKLYGQMSMTQRLVNFLQVTTLELEEANRKLKKMAITDGLTKLHNRAHIERIGVKAIKAAKLIHRRMSVIMLDIDDFKHINDTYGHDVGDMVLVCIAEIIRINTGEFGDAGRWGGEEFMILIECEESEAYVTAEHIRSMIETTNFGPVAHVTVSIGVTAIKEEEPMDIYKRVDAALYQAKTTGKNRVVVL